MSGPAGDDVGGLFERHDARLLLWGTRVEENTAADQIQLTEAQLARLNNLEPAAGACHDDANMGTIDR